MVYSADKNGCPDDVAVPYPYEKGKGRPMTIERQGIAHGNFSSTVGRQPTRILEKGRCNISDRIRILTPEESLETYFLFLTEFLLSTTQLVLISRNLYWRPRRRMTLLIPPVR